MNSDSDANSATSRAAEDVVDTEQIAIRLPGVGEIRLPPAEHLAYYAGIGLLAAFDILDWPAALVLGLGHALLSQQRHPSMRQLGEALEEWE